MEKKHPLYVVKAEIVEIKKHAKAGKPKAGEEKIVVGYQRKFKKYVERSPLN